MKENFDEIKLYLRTSQIISKKSDAWKIQLAIAISFISFKDNDEELIMHSNSNNIEIMIYDLADEVIKYFF